MLAMSRDLGLSYKAAFVLCHKMREAMAEELKGRTIGGEGKEAEIDGGYLAVTSSPQTSRTSAGTAACWQNQSGKRKCVVIVRERGGNSLPAVFRSEGQALNSFGRVLPRAPSSMPMKARHGMICMPVTK